MGDEHEGHGGGRTVVVTGSAGGIGSALRRWLEARGHRVIGVDLHDAEVVADLATVDGRAAMVDQVGARCGGVLDGVVAGAGRIDADDATVVATNHFGAVATLEGLRPMLARGSSPAAVAISSNSTTTYPGVTGDLAEAVMGAADEASALAVPLSGLGYPVSKTALAWWVRRQAPTADWIGSGIRLNAVAPGFVDTPMTAGTWDDVASLGDIYPMPLGRPGRPEEVASLIGFLLGPDAGLLNGALVVADGGTDAALRATDWPRPLGG